MYVLNFYSPLFVDQILSGRKTGTIRLGDKSHKYKRGHLVCLTIGYKFGPREKIADAVIDDVEVKRISELSPRDVQHDNPEFRRIEETIRFLEQIYGGKISADDTITMVRFAPVIDRGPERSAGTPNGRKKKQ